MWTKDRVEMLQKLWAAGLSANRIAVALGCGFSRNAIIGKAHRLGLSVQQRVRDPNAPKPERKPRKRNGPPRNPRPRRLPDRPLDRPALGIPQPGLLPKLTIDEDDLNIIPITQRCSIFELREDRCHFPFGDPLKAVISVDTPEVDTSTFFYCGGKADFGSPYCGYHHRICYHPNPERRRQALHRREDRIRESKRLEAMAAKFGAGLSGITRDDQFLEDLDGSSREGERRPYEKTADWTEA